jgi:hypothetical protein
MEIVQNYPIAFFVTVLLPTLTGIVLSIGGYESLKSRAAFDTQLNRIEKIRFRLFRSCRIFLPQLPR